MVDFRSLRAKLFIFSLIVLVFVVGIVYLFGSNYMNRVSKKTNENYAMVHLQKYQERFNTMMHHSIKITEDMLTSHTSEAFLKNEKNLLMKENAFQNYNKSLRLMQANGWFIGHGQSLKYYYDDINHSFKGHELRKILNPHDLADTWFFATSKNEESHNINIDFDKSVNKTNIWLNMPIKIDNKFLGVGGIAIAFDDFISEYLEEKNGVQSIITDKNGNILVAKDTAMVNFNLFTIKQESQEQKNFKSLLYDQLSKDHYNKILNDLYSTGLEQSSTVVSIQGVKSVLVGAKLAYCNWVMFSYIPIETIHYKELLLKIFGIIFFIALIILASIFYFVKRYLIKPIEHIAKISDKVKQGDLSARASIKEDIEEIYNLSIHFNEMIAKIEQSAQESETKYKWLTENTHDVIWVMSLDLRLTYVSPSVFALRGYTPQEVLNQTLEEVIDIESISTVKRFMNEAIEAAKQGRIPNVQTMLIKQPHKDGHTIWTEANGRLILNEKGEPIQFIGSTRDVTERIRAEEEIKQLAFYDHLTGLANRRLLIDRLEQAMAKAKREKRLCAFLFLDMDKFKALNDTYGHKIGDEMLAEVAERIRKCIRATDTAARFGGDEFAILVETLNENIDIANLEVSVIAEKIRKSLSEPYELSIVTYEASSSVGCRIFDHNDDVKVILHDADIAMYSAKQNGKNRFELFKACPLVG